VKGLALSPSLYTVGGRWFHQSEAWTNWCEGFLGGMQWIFARRTGDQWWCEHAAACYSMFICVSFFTLRAKNETQKEEKVALRMNSYRHRLRPATERYGYEKRV
jgi:hypothetical protein